MRNRYDMRINWPLVGGIAVIAALLIMVMIFNRASIQRTFKSLKSEYDNGIERTVTVYDYSGSIIREYHGKFDVTESKTGIMFDDDETGKRTIITGGIVINEEQ